MKKLLNKEFRLSIANMLALEEHLIEMLSLTVDDSIQRELFAKLKENKENRNKLLTNSESEKERSEDFNKWCAIKHLMLAQYHLMEYINQNDKSFDDVKNLFPQITSLDKAIEDLLKTKFDGKCETCTGDIFINKFGLTNFFKKGK